jgi:ribonuclease HI
MPSNKLHSITFYTDGACSGNHRTGKQGRMGAGIVGIADGVQREWSVPLGPGTNQMAELLAVRAALLKVRDRPRTRVTIITDSQYAIGCLTGGWKVVANRELVEEIRPLIAECAAFRMEKVLGHAGQEENERADRLAVAATKEGAVETSARVEAVEGEPLPTAADEVSGVSEPAAPKPRARRRKPTGA